VIPARGARAGELYRFARGQLLTFGFNRLGEDMESMTDLLADALAPYKVDFSNERPDGVRVLYLRNEAGECLIQRAVRKAQLQDRRLLTDVVDGLLRDLLVIEGRVAPDVVAVLRGQDRVRAYASL
jgi:hypothetical protein